MRFHVYKVHSFGLQVHAQNRRNVHHELLQRRSFVVELAEFGADTNWSLAVGQKFNKLKKLEKLKTAGGHWFKNEWKPVRASGSLN